MKDVQSGPAQVAMPIDRVGVKSLKLPLVVSDRAKGRQHTVAQVDMFVNLPAKFKGTHMSRFVAALEEFSEELNYKSLKSLLHDVRDRLHAESSRVVFRFPYFLQKRAPATDSAGFMSYQCRLQGELGPGSDRPGFLLEVAAPVMTVCPCSKAISEEGAHSQRAEVRIQCRFTGFVWIEDLIAMAEAAGSAPVYSLVKREDEKALTEAAFANPAFVEDTVRHAARALEEHPQITWYRVEVESFESIHNHSAYAAIESRVDPGRK